MLIDHRKSLSSHILMASKHFLLKSTPSPPPPKLLLSSRTYYSRIIFSAFSPKPTSNLSPFYLKTCGFCSTLHAATSTTVELKNPEMETQIYGKPMTLNEKLKKLGIDLDHFTPGNETRLTCPMCKGGDSGEKSLSLLITEEGGSAVWNCFRAKCGWRGSTRTFAGGNSSYLTMKNKMTKVNKIRQITEEELELHPLCSQICEYFAERMISRETLRRNFVMQRTIDDKFVIAFTYRRNDELISCKYRGANKRIWQAGEMLFLGNLFTGIIFLVKMPNFLEKDTEKIFYGLDDIKGASDIIIVADEIDKLSMEEAGFRNCVSVPDGTPPQVSKNELPHEEEDTKYQYLWNCKDYLEKASRIILATDGDTPGQALAEELARRLGKERCWRVKWPKISETNYFKDANQVLMFLGPEALREVVENAELYPIKGLFNFHDFAAEIDVYYHQMLDYQLGVSTGWRALDNLYNVVPGELTIVTGVPNSGKSEWIDALLCNLCESVGWKFALCSMENKVREHARKLLEKHVKKPFFELRYGESFERMSVEEFELGKQWLSDTFSLIRCENDCLPSIEWVLGLAKAAVLRHGVNGLVIDPYNELDHQRPTYMTETEYVSQMLTKVKRFAQHHSCHVWFVAHPRQLHNWVGDAPNLYDISGSAHFINKCDNGIVIHRNRDPTAGPLDRVQVCVRKVRNKAAGTIGDAFLSYKRVTGEFVDIDDN